MNLQRLIYLCHLKNELNRKRRRFYCIWRELSGNAYNNTGKKKHKSFTISGAWKGYKQAQTDMKAMTAEMRQMRVELGVKFLWNDGGLIYAIKFDEQRISQKDFKRFYESEIFEFEFFKAE